MHSSCLKSKFGDDKYHGQKFRTDGIRFDVSWGVYLPGFVSRFSPEHFAFAVTHRPVFREKVAAEYILDRCVSKQPNLRWACSARNKSKAEIILTKLAQSVQSANNEASNVISPEILQVDLLCKTEEEENKL